MALFLFRRRGPRKPTLSDVMEFLKIINHKEDRIMVAQAQTAQQLRDLLAQNERDRAETLALLQELRDALGNAGETSQEVTDALNALAASIQQRDDDVVPNA